MNVDVMKLTRKKPLSEEQRLMSQRTAIFTAARGLGPHCLEAYPLLTPEEASQRGVGDQVYQTLCCIMDDMPGPIWKEPGFTDQIRGMLQSRLVAMTARPAAEEAKSKKRLGHGFESDAP